MKVGVWRSVTTGESRETYRCAHFCKTLRERLFLTERNVLVVMLHISFVILIEANPPMPAWIYHAWRHSLAKLLGAIRNGQ